MRVCLYIRVVFYQMNSSVTVVVVTILVVMVMVSADPHCRSCGHNHHHGAAVGLAYAGVSTHCYVRHQLLSFIFYLSYFCSGNTSLTKLLNRCCIIFYHKIIQVC